MSSGDPSRGCPNCHCPSCRLWRQQYQELIGGTDASDCAYDWIARDYAARGEPSPQVLMLYCPCRRCNPICM